MEKTLTVSVTTDTHTSDETFRPTDGYRPFGVDEIEMTEGELREWKAACEYFDLWQELIEQRVRASRKGIVVPPNAATLRRLTDAE